LIAQGLHLQSFESLIVKKPQHITILISVVVLSLLFVFGKTIHKPEHGPDDGHDHATQNTEGQGLTSSIQIDSLLIEVKKELSAEQISRLDLLEKSISQSDRKNQQIHVFHQLANFWRDTGRHFIPYTWYTAEAARLENSEKSLTFAGHLLLNGLQQQHDPELRKWMALQSKDLFERSLILNPDNDSSKVGVGATYLFGGISQMPMEGINKVKEVTNRDSTNVYAQMTLAMGSLMSGQTEKAQERLLTVTRLQPDNAEAALLLGDLFEKKGNKALAITYYSKASAVIKRTDIKAEIDKRISDLKK